MTREIETNIRGAARITRRFSDLRAENRAGLVAFLSAGDPDPDTALALLKGLPGAGVDVIELGMPFSDPMADGPAIQESSQRALRSGQTMKKTLDMVAAFRAGDTATPMILMGYYNPIYIYGVDRFIGDATSAGVDGLIVVDLPPEEDAELRKPLQTAGLSLIRLITPTTDAARLPVLLDQAGGFLYYVSITGITGTRVVPADAVAASLAGIRAKTALPIAVGFGIRTPEHAGEIARMADAVVVGSAIVERVAAGLDGAGKAKPDLVERVFEFVAELAKGVRGTRIGAAAGRAPGAKKRTHS